MHAFQAMAVPEWAVGIHWFGQSSFAIKDTHGTIVQIDPFFPHDRPAEWFIHATPPLDESTLRTDAVLLTHNHDDHTLPESLLRIREAFPACRFVGPRESIDTLLEHGIGEDKLQVVEVGETVTLGSMQVHAVWAKPPGGAPEDGIEPPDVAHFGYVIEAGGVRIYVSGDPVNTFGEHEELLAPIAARKPHIGFLTTHPTEGEFPYFDGSVKIATRLGLKTAVPAHYQCFVKRNYDPQIWADAFPEGGPETLIIPYNSAVIYQPPS
jgi:L-ascorbate metabolism protein UlaG (beta-lactamase superfamily)